MDIKYQLIKSGTKRRSGLKVNNIVFFVDHDTGNPGSTAQNNADYYCNTADVMSASAHIFIDDKEAICVIPCVVGGHVEKAWHVLYERTQDNILYGDDANDIAVGLELCYFPGDIVRSHKAYENYVDVAAELCYRHSVNPSKRSGHYQLDPQRKTDPGNALKYIGLTYATMKQDIEAKYRAMYKKAPVVIANDAVATAYAQPAQLWAKQTAISDGTMPHLDVLRYQIFCMLYRYLNGSKEKSNKLAAEYLVEMGITDGRRPEDVLSRVELWCLLYRASGNLTALKDWQTEAKNWAMAQGITDGTNPTSNVKRQDGWVMLHRSKLRG